MKRYLLILTISTLFIVGCGKSSSSGGGGGTGSTTSSTQDISAIVSTGMSLSYNDMTGGANDVMVNPVTHLPAVAYYDKNAPVSGTTAIGALKYAYMSANGSWTTEVVDANYGTAACGVVNSFCMGAPNAPTGSTSGIIKLAFTSTGSPVIAYVFGASLAGGNKQVRYAERINGGTAPWKTSVAYSINTAGAATSATVTATIDPLKGVALSLDSQDRPHIVVNVYTFTITNSATRYMFRASSGVWTVNDIIVHVGGAGTITALGQGGQQMGMAICPSTGMPFVAGGVVTGAAGIMAPYMFYCSTLAATGACSAWTTVNLLTGCTGGLCFSSGIVAGNNAGQRADAVIDPANNKILLGYYNTSTTTAVTGESGSTCGAAQTTAVGSYGAMGSLGPAASTPGLGGFRLAASATKWYASYTNTTINTMMNVATAGTWLNPGNILDTTTVALEGVGLAYDSTNDVLWSSYASLPGAAAGSPGNDIKVGHAQPGDIVVSGLNGTLYTDVVDTTVTLFPSAAVPMITAAKAADGTVGYAFFYQDNTATNDRLYYGIRGGSSTAPRFGGENLVTNQVTTTGATLVGTYPSLAYDSSSNPFIAFYDGLAADQLLYVATSNNGGSYFSLTQVDHSATQVGQYPSAAAFGSSIGVSYYDFTNKGLKFARLSNGVWKRYAVDGGGSAANCNNVLEDDGAWSSLTFTSTGAPVIVYQSNSSNLKIAYATQPVTSSPSTAFTWTCIMVDASAATRGNGIAVALNSSDQPYIAHFDSTAGTIRMVTCPKAIGTCITDGPNDFTGVIVNGSGILTTTVTKPTIQIDPSNKVYIGYYSASFQGLQIASQAAGATAWTLENIDASNSGASYISGAGQYAQLLLNSSNLPMVFYRSNENWLKYFSREPK